MRISQDLLAAAVRRLAAPRWLLVATLAAAAITLVPARAAASAPIGLTVTVMSDSLLTLDSNKPTTSGPNTMFVHFRVTNTSGVVQRGLLATATIADPAVLQLAGNQASSQYLTTLAPGASTDVYWFVTYTRTIGLRTTLTMTVTDGAGKSDALTAPVRTSSMISSGTGGTLDAQTLRATYLGMTTSIEVTYIFAGISVGGTYNMQPAGTTSLDAGCFQLVGSEVLSSDQPANIPPGTKNQMFFIAGTSYGGSGARVAMRFDFRVQCLGVASQVKPYANETSGSTNLKYSSNFDTWTGGTGGTVTFPTVINPISVAKSATPDSLTDGGTATYTITLANSQSGTAVVDSIVDVLPPGVTFDSIASTSQVTAGNSAALPAAGATGTIRFRSVPGTFYTVPASGTLRLVFKATIPKPEGTYTNSATGWVAKTNAGTGTASTVVRRKSDLTVLKAGPDSARVLDTLAYVIRTTNLGPSAADSVIVRDTLPAKLAFLRASRAATVAGQVVTLATWPQLAKDSTLRDTIYVTATDTGSVTNVAVAASQALDPVPANSDGTGTASRYTTLLRPELVSVTVTPHGLPTPVRRIGGSFYTQDFVVTNGARRPHAFDLRAALEQPVAFLTRDSLRTVADAFHAALTTSSDSVRVTFGNGVPTTVTIVYSVAQGDTAEGTISLSARAVADPAARDSGWATVRRVRPLLTLAKSVTPNANVVPGTELTYTVAFGNDGEWDASAAVIVDHFPAPLALKIGTVTPTLPAGLSATTEFSDDDGATWTYTPVSGGCSAPGGYDACVTRIRLSLDGPLPAGAAASAGQLQYVARVP